LDDDTTVVAFFFQIHCAVGARLQTCTSVPTNVHMLNAGSLNDAFATHIRIIKKKLLASIVNLSISDIIAIVRQALPSRSVV